MPKIIATKGLPGSGKSLFVLPFLKANPTAVRANRDDIRFALFGKYWGKGVNEKKVTEEQDRLAKEALSDPDGILVMDDTNLSPQAVAHILTLSSEYGAEVEWIDFTHIPITQCIRNDISRDRSVGEDVIRGMWDRYLKPPTLPDNGKPRCYIFDVDGTLAIHQDRGPFEWHRVGEDLPNPTVVKFAQQSPERVVVMSGRDEICRTGTEGWLMKQHIPYVELLMRPEGDMRPDDIVKNELLDDLLTRWYPVLAVDDRQKVVDNVWRARGIECWQVAPGRF